MGVKLNQVGVLLYIVYILYIAQYTTKNTKKTTAKIMAPDFLFCLKFFIIVDPICTCQEVECSSACSIFNTTVWHL